MQQEAPTQITVAAATLHARLRGTVDLGRLRRLSDVLNHAAIGYLPLLDAEIQPHAAPEAVHQRPRLYVSKCDLLFVYPTGAGPRPLGVPGLVVTKLQAPVGLYVADYHLEGIVHPVDRVPWEQYLALVRDRFLALTEATVTSLASGDSTAFAFVAVNREHVSALYPL